MLINLFHNQFETFHNLLNLNEITRQSPKMS